MKKGRRVIIIGAGVAGVSLAKEIATKRPNDRIRAFLDDDKQKIGTIINDIPVLGPIESCITTFDGSREEEIILAIPSAPPKKIETMYKALLNAGYHSMKILPSVSQIINGHPHLVQARDIDPQDLLGRHPVTINLQESLSYLRGKRVLVTGAGGSIGSEISRQLLYAGVERLYIFGHGENSIYTIHHELNTLQEGGVGEKTFIVPVIGDLQERDYMFHIMKRLQADIVFHCAAHKHVPMMERNPVEAVKNNVFGTLNLTEASKSAGVTKFVLISTDKAVDPISIYGATKKISEKIVLKENTKEASFKVVRFGNVLGSRGSIIPLFKKQILAGGPITITHPDMRRFFMTIPEAVSLVLQAGSNHKDSLNLLDMGEPVKITDIVFQMIKFYGYEKDEIPITFIGLRGGEKLEEKLSTTAETLSPSDFPKIFSVCDKKAETFNLNELLNDLRPICFLSSQYPSVYRDRRELRKVIKKHIPGVPEIPNEEQF